jgi:hypothetical protein
MGARAVASIHAILGEILRGMAAQERPDFFSKRLFISRKAEFHGLLPKVVVDGS